MNSFEIIVNAVDSGTPIPETATTTVYVNVKDINDERPKFEQNSYAAYVSERTAVGESVLRVKAIDKDLNSKLEYGLVGPVTATTKAGVNIANRSNYRLQEAFRVDSQTGEIFDIHVLNTRIHKEKTSENQKGERFDLEIPYISKRHYILQFVRSHIDYTFLFCMLRVFKNL